jgi:hypothetical protein
MVLVCLSVGWSTGGRDKERLGISEVSDVRYSGIGCGVGGGIDSALSGE